LNDSLLPDLSVDPDLDPAFPPDPVPAGDVLQPRDTLRVVEHGGRTFWLVGTAHVSRRSVEEVRQVVEAVRPDTVAVELCQARYESLTDEHRWAKLDIFEVIRRGRFLFLLASLALTAWQRRMGAALGVRPGAELLEGVRAAEEVGAAVELIDRDVNRTLSRAWAAVGWWRRLQLLSGLLQSFLEPAGKEDDTVTEAQIEGLKEEGRLQDMMGEFARALPEVKAALIDERDWFMVERLRQVPGQRVVAVVGAGHVPGMVAAFDQTHDLAALDAPPRPSPWIPLLKWGLPALVLAAFAVGYVRTQGQSLEYMLWAWIVPNAVLAGLMTLVAGGRALTVLAATVASPITSLNPLIAAGFVAGFVEAWLRRPTVEDAERMPDDIQTWRGLHRNPFTRVLIVALAANIGSALGAWVGAAWLFSAVTGQALPG
jgi:pheromone shutdown-related protein TraB